MIKAVRGLFLSILVCALVFTPRMSFSAEMSVNKTFPPVEWSYGGNEIPETYWTPYLPLGAQTLTRYRIGFRFSTGTISVKCPIKLTFKYDPASATAGSDISIKVKAEIIGADHNTFESAFGLHLPNEFQIGFVGVTGVPDFLPWYTLPWDICEILGSVPGLPDAVSQKVTLICSAIDNVGVNMATKGALKLPGMDSYHDTRTLLEVSFNDFFDTTQERDAFKNDLGISLFNSLSEKMGAANMDRLLATIQVLKGVNEAGAAEFLTDQCISAAGKLMSLSFAAIGDPYFSIEGVELQTLLRMYIPGGKGGGTYPLVFTSSGQEQTVTFRDVTPFIDTNDKLVVTVDSMAYRFKLKQGLTPTISIPVYGEIDIDPYEKYVTLATAKRDFTESDYKLEIPLSPSTAVVQGLRVNPGCVSASVNFASPLMPVKATVKTYEGNTLVKTTAENAYKLAHNIIVTDLQKSKSYRFEMTCANAAGETFPGGTISATTKSNCEPRENSLTCNSTTMSGMTAMPVTVLGKYAIDFGWQTNDKASTEVLISPSPDLSANYIAAVQKADGTVTQGWVTQGGERRLEWTHAIRVTDLEPGTKYYYNIVSWTFQDDNPTKNPMNRVGYVGEVTTNPAPPAPTVKVCAQTPMATVSNVPIEVWKSGATEPLMVVTTGGNGVTSPVNVDRNTAYTM
ncbi:MAG TPA: fibronectin type III domain-containing protein, partial [Candidatus Omnitrophota bacterium]|nr:fibronectin type III domain-containing protein [Candidatus Omnitrophota bacterium]